MGHMAVSSELLQIKLIITDEHNKLLEEIAKRKHLITNSHSHYIDIPERIQKAFSYVERLSNENKDVLTTDEIGIIHGHLGCGGRFRKPSVAWYDTNNIAVNGYHPPIMECDNLENLMSEYTRHYTLIENSSNPLEKACRAYFVLEQIHPFNDGNGRTGRAICAWLMFKYGYGFLTSYLEKRWGQENQLHAEAFKSESKII